ncbi:hypothetical protein [Streptomyces sp. NPDC057686]
MTGRFAGAQRWAVAAGAPATPRPEEKAGAVAAGRPAGRTGR